MGPPVRRSFIISTQGDDRWRIQYRQVYQGFPEKESRFQSLWLRTNRVPNRSHKCDHYPEGYVDQKRA